MKKILFIIPYFGKFNNYFPLFLKSCEKNSDYNWLIITDDKTTYKFPNNVKVIYNTFEHFSNKVKKTFPNVRISLETPYKLCDFKPAYGYIFKDYVSDYDYWGYCDIDLIFGKINNFLNFENEAICKYDKIGVLGHFSLYKNTKEINTMFLKDNRYLTVLTSEKIFKFDEEYGEDFGPSINNLFKKYKKKILEINSFADIFVKSSNFKRILYYPTEHLYKIEKKDKSFYLWNQGVLKKFTIKGKRIFENEYLYIHLQKRPMRVKINLNSDIYKIIPNAFEPIEKNFMDKNNINKIKTKNFNIHYFKIRFKNLITKIKNKFKRGRLQ